MQVQSKAECSKVNLSDNLSWKPIFSLFESGGFTVCRIIQIYWLKAYKISTKILCSDTYTDLTLCLLGIFSCFFCRLLIFSKSNFSKNSFRNTISVSDRMDPDQSQRFVYVGPDLGPNCLQRLSADNTSRSRANQQNHIKAGQIRYQVTAQSFVSTLWSLQII